MSLADDSGRAVSSPPRRGLQVIVFADHSLKAFPSLVEGLKKLSAEATDREIIILLREHNPMAVSLLHLLGLGTVPVVTGSPSLYGRYNVRVMPWMMLVDADGTVRSSSLVNAEWQISRLWKLARLAPPPTPSKAARLLRLPKVWAGA